MLQWLYQDNNKGERMNDLERFKELELIIGKLIIKPKKSLKDFEKLDSLQDEQHSLMDNSDVQEYINSNNRA